MIPMVIIVIIIIALQYNVCRLKLLLIILGWWLWSIASLSMLLGKRSEISLGSCIHFLFCMHAMSYGQFTKSFSVRHCSADRNGTMYFKFSPILFFMKSSADSPFVDCNGRCPFDVWLLPDWKTFCWPSSHFITVSFEKCTPSPSSECLTILWSLTIVSPAFPVGT